MIIREDMSLLADEKSCSVAPVLRILMTVDRTTVIAAFNRQTLWIVQEGQAYLCRLDGIRVGSSESADFDYFRICLFRVVKTAECTISVSEVKPAKIVFLTVSVRANTRLTDLVRSQRDFTT